MGDIIGECIHGLTADWCSICKAKKVPRSTSHNEKVWGDFAHKGPGSTRSAISGDILAAYPHTIARFDSECPWCGGALEEAVDTVYLVEGSWVCDDCATMHLSHPSRNRR